MDRGFSRRRVIRHRAPGAESLKISSTCTASGHATFTPLEDRFGMSKRLDPSWVVVESIENAQHDRCVDVFARPDGSFGFEEFRRDPEDAGAWTPVSYFSGMRYASKREVLTQAARRVAWLAAP